ncbi:aldehyde dehydrogenase family protein [Brevibacterium linens]|uniref:aldehyde dehydrogenase family protein n=1 Tax=Brevibacterium linens TaxID=1703 RepID=UPI00240825BF|nr:aldehyde dehydrogenase family protein [Brevibacterium linens]
MFGPVVTIETFESEDEANTRANEVPYGLAAEVPWGGFKGSGYGRDLSIYALNDFSRTKHVQINHAR